MTCSSKPTSIVALSAVLVLVLRHPATRLQDLPAPQHRNAPSIDGLTKLPTRLNFEDELAGRVAKADATKSRLALLFIDLDGFKPVNDTFGHGTGDLVLKEVGERLRAMSREGDTITRIGGDEFVLMVTGNPSQEAAAQVAKRLIDDISRPYDIGDRAVVISCSIGIVMYPDSGAHTKLIARADAAMYEAKRSGGGCYCFYTSAMDEDTRDKFDLVNDLRQAIDNNEMELFYQPKIDARSGQVTAAEALLRWKHPKRGMVPPNVFIPLAERFGLIGALGNWVIEDACRQARRWREHACACGWRSTCRRCRCARRISSRASWGRWSGTASIPRCSPARSPSRWRWRTPRPRSAPSAGWARRACTCRSTTSAPATRA
jgi:diguanylate cyclase (GGDEF)-like protein